MTTVAILDYVIDEERKICLQSLVQQFKAGLSHDAAPFVNDPLSTPVGIHISGTEGQSASDSWHQWRQFRITASSFKDFAAHPETRTKKMWDAKTDLSFLKAIKWGLDHEDVAREAYEAATESTVQMCGLFVSKECPIFGASPDGLIEQESGLLEIKCPYSLRNESLFLLDSTKNYPFFTIIGPGRLQLKRTHSYFFQVQLAMYVTGCRYTDFFI
jgi:hypothetical protein